MLPALGLLAQAAPSIFQYVTGDDQEEQARKLKYVDETPEAEKEALALAEQKAADARLPSEGLLADRISQQATAAATAARAAGGSGVSVLAALNANQRNSENALADLAVKSAENQQRNQAGLAQELSRAGGFQKMSRDKYNAAKSALIEGAKRNKFGALTGGAATLAYGATKYDLPGATPTAATTAAVPAAVGPGIGPGRAGGGKPYAGVIPYDTPEDMQYQRLFGGY